MKNINEKVSRRFELVPEIGAQWRWYDIIYRLLEWWLKSWRRRIVPPALRHLLVRGMNFLAAFNQHERNKAEPLDELSHTLIIPDKVQLRQGGVWTVELFPPSRYKALERSLQRNGWNRSDFTSSYGTNTDQVKRAREGRGFGWSRICTVAQTKTRYLIPGTKREVLPEEFEYIELTAFQLGTSVTALVAYFQLSEIGESSLDRVWRGEHEPKLIWRGLRQPIVVGRYFSAIEATQRERMRIHGLARHWLSRRCPGFFASQSNVHPVLDLNLFDGMDPVSGKEEGFERDALRALGMKSYEHHKYISPQMRGCVLIPSDMHGGPHEPIRNCWAIAGEYKKILNENERPEYGNEPYSPLKLGHMFSEDGASVFILHLAIMSYLSEQKAIYSESRDLASTKHKRFTSGKVRKLSEEILESSLDLPAVARDSRYLWSRRWHSKIDVQALPSGLYQKDYGPYDFIKFIGKNCEKEFQLLLEQDESYRTVLSTVAALGASADAVRTGRIALFVAAGSMIVAMITLLITQTGDASLWSSLVMWLGWDL